MYKLKLRADLIGFHYVPGWHTGEHLATAFLYITDQLNITHKVCSFSWFSFVNLLCITFSIGWATLNNASNNNTWGETLEFELGKRGIPFSISEQHIQYVYFLTQPWKILNSFLQMFSSYYQLSMSSGCQCYYRHHSCTWNHPCWCSSPRYRCNCKSKIYYSCHKFNSSCTCYWYQCMNTRYAPHPSTVNILLKFSNLSGFWSSSYYEMLKPGSHLPSSNHRCQRRSTLLMWAFPNCPIILNWWRISVRTTT